MPAPKWNKEIAFEIASEFDNRTEFLKAYGGAYHWLHRRGLLQEACTHMPSNISTITKAEAFKTTALFNTIGKFRELHPKMYDWLHRRGFLRDACRHMSDGRTFTRSIFAPVYKTTGVYFLYDNDELVYIGKSNRSVGKRLSDHSKDVNKEFTKAVVYSIANSADTNIAEMYLISLHSPKYNKDSNVVEVPTLSILNLDSIIIEEVEIILEEKVESNV